MPSKKAVSRATVKPEHLFLIAYTPAPGEPVVNRLAVGESVHAALHVIRTGSPHVEILHATSLAVMVAAVDTVKRMAQAQGIEILA